LQVKWKTIKLTKRVCRQFAYH